jgi:methylated-DNA-[protein]-cysteine S-methyltransferase
MMSRTHTVVPSPIGPLTVVRDEDGALVRLAMSPPGALEAGALGERDDAGFEDVARQLAEYFAGERTEFELELRPAGTDFQHSVWELLLGIPYGETTSYGALALELGDPRKVRAVGLANGRNPISIVVPCHRVIGADGSLTGYGGGLERKRQLLALEAEVAAGFRATLW